MIDISVHLLRVDRLVVPPLGRPCHGKRTRLDGMRTEITIGLEAPSTIAIRKNANGNLFQL